jgi:ketosteroid isomerase-like protein
MRCFGERFLMCLVLAGGVAAVARAEDEIKAVRTAAREYAAAVASGDAERVRESWTTVGDYVDAGGRTRKVSSIVKQMAARPGTDEKAPADVAPPNSSLRFVTPTVAIEDGEFECGVSGNGSPMSGRFTAVWVKQDGRWLLDSLRESVTAGPQVDKQLRPLEWLLGEWVAETDDAAMLVSARLSDHGNQIVREFAMIGDGGATTATERIAWDPEDRALKSWTFDSQDGRSESTWTRDGKSWRVETKEVMEDEKPATTLATITPAGRGQHVWEVKSSKVGDQSVPPRRVTFRLAPE